MATRAFILKKHEQTFQGKSLLTLRNSFQMKFI